MSREFLRRHRLECQRAIKSQSGLSNALVRRFEAKATGEKIFRQWVRGPESRWQWVLVAVLASIDCIVALATAHLKRPRLGDA